MSAGRRKDLLPELVPAPDVSADDRTVLAGAYKAGLIVAWKLEALRGYRLTLAGQREEYVEVAQLTKYVEKLASARAALAPPPRSDER